MALEELQLIEQQIVQLDQEIASLLRQHQDAIQRLAEVHGPRVDSAQQNIANVGTKAATFASAKNRSSWVGTCPGEEESAGANSSPRSPKGNRHMRRLLNQAAMLGVPVKHRLPGFVFLAQHQVQVAPPVLIALAKPTEAIPLRIRLCVFFPQRLQAQMAMLSELMMNGFQSGCGRCRTALDGLIPKQLGFEFFFPQVLGQRPTDPGRSHPHQS